MTYYYLLYFEFWCINWRYEDRERHDVQLADLQTNFVLFSIPFFDIEFLVSFPGFYIPFYLLSLFLFCELVFLLLYFYRCWPISLFSFYVIIFWGVFLWTVFLLNLSLALDCTASWVIIDCIIPWLIINSCQHTSANSNQLSWWLHF